MHRRQRCRREERFVTALILPEEPPASPRLSLLVVPQAGGGAAMAAGLQEAASDGWLVAGTSFGGRETRFIDPPPAGRGEMVDDVVEAAVELAGMGAPVVLVGQCSGALIGYLAAARLEQLGSVPDALVAVSRGAPAVSGELPDLDLPDEQFVERIIGLGWVHEELAAMPELLELLLPAIRADCAALTAEPTAEPVPGFAVPTLAVHAADDKHCPPSAVNAWIDYAPLAGRVELAGADHLLLSERPAVVAAVMATRLPELISVGGTR
jgi:surfactin synthase thioesterase subunit